MPCPADSASKQEFLTNCNELDLSLVKEEGGAVKSELEDLGSDFAGQNADILNVANGNGMELSTQSNVHLEQMKRTRKRQWREREYLPREEVQEPYWLAASQRNYATHSSIWNANSHLDLMAAIRYYRLVEHSFVCH